MGSDAVPGTGRELKNPDNYARGIVREASKFHSRMRSEGARIVIVTHFHATNPLSQVEARTKYRIVPFKTCAS